MNSAAPPLPKGIAATPSARRWLALLGVLAVAALLLMYEQTTRSTVAIWERSETFAHGFLIFPISAFLVWRRRHALAAAPLRPDYRGLLLLAALGFGWLLADLADVLVVAQYCLVAMIPAAIWTVFGTRVVRAIAFPLGFLFFAVPVGEVLILPLMHFTADFTVSALRLSGIPVYREGTFFTIPSGNWSVVEGCSGLRYLIAAFTLGCLYAYLTYRSTRRRLVFAAMSIVVPIIANGLRAYTIVMIATLIDKRLALGIDHLIYGWLFFGAVMMLLFWIGSFWREDPPQESLAAGPAGSAAVPPARVAARPVLVAALSVIALAAVWPGYAAYLSAKPAPAGGLGIPVPAGSNGWHAAAEPLTSWKPRYAKPDAFLSQTYRKDGKTVAVYLEYYRAQRQGTELITSTNIMVYQKDPVWGNVGSGLHTANIAGRNLSLRETRLRSATQRLLIWDWDRIQGRHLVNPYLAKLLFAKARLLGQPDDGTAIILATPYQDETAEAASVLRDFVHDMLPSIEASLKAVSRQGTSQGGPA